MRWSHFHSKGQEQAQPRGRNISEETEKPHTGAGTTGKGVFEITEDIYRMYFGT